MTNLNLKNLNLLNQDFTLLQPLFKILSWLLIKSLLKLIAVLSVYRPIQNVSSDFKYLAIKRLILNFILSNYLSINRKYSQVLECN